MIIIRKMQDPNYFAASSEPFNDQRLSWGARGLLAFLLSQPEGWAASVAELVLQGQGEERQVRRMLAELRQHCYLSRTRTTLAEGTIEWVAMVSENTALTHRGESLDAAAADNTPLHVSPVLATPGSQAGADQQAASLAAFEETFGALSASDQLRLLDMEDTYSPAWVSDAIREAAEYHPGGDLKYPLVYVRRIIERWKADGKRDRFHGSWQEDPEARQQRINAKIERFIRAQSGGG